MKGTRSGGTSAGILGGVTACLAAFMLATFLPLPEAAATNYTDTACEGQKLNFVVQRPRPDVYDGKLTYKIRVTGGSAEEGKDYKRPVGSLTWWTGSGSENFTVKTLGDQIAENDETVRLELYEPETGQWIQRYGITVQPESLMPQTMLFKGTIRDWANAERQGAWKIGGLGLVRLLTAGPRPACASGATRT